MPDPHAESFQTLHRFAEEKARLDEAAALQTLTLDDARQLFHDLRVYQIELEMQNEELRATQARLGAAILVLVFVGARACGSVMECARQGVAARVGEAVRGAPSRSKSVVGRVSRGSTPD